MKKIIPFIIIGFLIISNVYANDPLKPQVLTNHLGYEPGGLKKAVVLGFDGDDFQSFKILEYHTDKMVMNGIVSKSGRVDRWKNWIFWTIDFSSLTQEGQYYIETTSKGKAYTSFPFHIQKDILERHTISDVVYFFKGQRPAGLNAKADKNMPVKAYIDGDKTKQKVIRTIDASGGWADATGDYSKPFTHLSASIFFNPQQNSLTGWSLFKTYEELDRRGEKGFTQFKRRILDEAMYGADYFVNMKIPGGSFYRSVSIWSEGKLAKNREILPARDNSDSYNISYREGAGIVIATLAKASSYPISGEHDNSDYLRAAEDAFAFLELNNASICYDKKENIVDDYCALMAAVELFKVTQKQEYKDAADKRANKLISRLISSKNVSNYWRADDTDRPFFHASDAGFPVISLLHYMEIAAEDTKGAVLETVRKSMEFELTTSREVVNPFGYARQYVQHLNGEREKGFFFPHDTETKPWWQGENARIASLAAAARLSAQFFGDDTKFQSELREYALNQLNWILGLNPYDSCMMEGTGRNNPQYLFYGSYEYKTSPGGIVNGITAGLNDYHDIDFEKGYVITGKDDDWRWLEQWLPHAAWYLYAASLEH